MIKNIFNVTISISIVVSLLSCERSNDLQTLSDWMTGSFTSKAQANSDSSYYEIELEMVRIWPERADGYWLYVEQAVASSKDRPYRQRVYQLTQNEDNSFKSEVYAFDNPLRFAGDWQKDNPLLELTPDSLILRDGCAVILKRISPDEFKGSTIEDKCKSSLRGASYATSEVLVTKDRIISWDRGFDADGNQVWGAEKGGYVFDKKTVKNE